MDEEIKPTTHDPACCAAPPSSVIATPRTDAAQKLAGTHWTGQMAIDADVARALERELAEAKETIKQLIDSRDEQSKLAKYFMDKLHDREASLRIEGAKAFNAMQERVNGQWVDILPYVFYTLMKGYIHKIWRTPDGREGCAGYYPSGDPWENLHREQARLDNCICPWCGDIVSTAGACWQCENESSQNRTRIGARRASPRNKTTTPRILAAPFCSVTNHQTT